MYEDCLDNALLSYLEVNIAIDPQIRTGNFGNWCIFDKNIFCQEREGCLNCMVRSLRSEHIHE